MKGVSGPGARDFSSWELCLRSAGVVIRCEHVWTRQPFKWRSYSPPMFRLVPSFIPYSFHTSGNEVAGMAMDLSKVGERNRLKAQREPHWQRLRAGCFIGFRPSKCGGKGTWIARAYEEDFGKYRVKSLGDFGTLPGNELFAAAKKEAEKLAELVESGAAMAILGTRIVGNCPSPQPWPLPGCRVKPPPILCVIPKSLIL